MSHQCPRDGCTRTVGDQFLFCGPDWRRVPTGLQRAVYAAYRGGAGLGSGELLAAQAAAIRAVNEPPGRADESAGGPPADGGGLW